MDKKSSVFVAITVCVIVALFYNFRPSAQNEENTSHVPTAPAIVEESNPSPEEKSSEIQQPFEDDIWSHNIWFGDYSDMVNRRIIRVLVPPGKTFFFLDKGQKRGLTYDNMMAFEKYINSHLKSKHMQVKVVVIPTSRDRLLPYLQQGYGDIAAGNLTITPDRLEYVDFTNPLLKNVEEIVVSSAKIPTLNSLFDLSGTEIYVRKSSSYYQSLLSLNNTLVSLGKEPVRLNLVDEYLEDEDLLEMVNTGLIPMIVMDSHKARFWEKIFSDIKLQSKVKLRLNGEIAFAVRKDSPELVHVLNDFVKENKKGTLMGNMLFRKYLENSNYIKNNLSDASRKKYTQNVELFQKYGRQYDFPHLLLVALAFQESGLEHSRRSNAGAIGIMQILPRTAADKNVNIQNITQLENNIHAGAKYLRFLQNRYFSNDDMDELNSHLFAIAAYNAGPARIAKLRKEAEKKGFDPNIWFNNVEVIASVRIGRETVQYVGNIYKYYIVYKHIVSQRQVKQIGKNLMLQHYKDK